MTTALSDRRELFSVVAEEMAAARAPRLRSMREFAEGDIIVPDGHWKGTAFRCSRQPCTGLWFDMVDRGLRARASGHREPDTYYRFAVYAPSQMGKTLACFVIPVMYHLFELRENVIIGVPDMNMAADKWLMTLSPAIAASRFAEYLPRGGTGSRGGTKVETVHFGNGTALKFMSAGGDDKRRAGYTAGVLGVTEVNAFKTPGMGSLEPNKLTQMEARLRSYSERTIPAVEYLECTVEDDQSLIVQEVRNGTDTRLALPCAHCSEYVTPTREHYRGWETAENEIEAGELTKVYCPACGQAWTEDEREAANHAARLVHRNQVIRPDGTVMGDPPKTATFGFRWSAVNNLFRSTEEVGRELWQANRDPNEDDAERRVCMFLFAEPYQSPDVELAPIKHDEIVRRAGRVPRGMVPAGTVLLTGGVDVGKWYLHWAVLAYSADGTPHVVDYGEVTTGAQKDQAEDAAVYRTLSELDDRKLGASAEWLEEGGGTRTVDLSLVDSHYLPMVVYSACGASRPDDYEAPIGPLAPVQGFGETQMSRRRFTQPTKTGGDTRATGDGWAVQYYREWSTLVVHADADHWKSYVHARLTTPAGQQGAMSLFAATPWEHQKFANHLTAERQVEEFTPEKGTRWRWVKQRKANHWFDATAYAMCAASILGVSVIPGQTRRPEPTPTPQGPMIMTPDGRPFLVTDR